MWFAAIIPLLTGIFGETGVLGKYLSTKAAQIQAQQELILQVERDKMQLSRDLAQAAVDSEKNKLSATSQTFKNIVFFMLSAPILLTMLAPGHGKAIFDSLSIVPGYYMQMYFTIIGVIWGLPVASNALSVIMAGVSSFLDARGERQVGKIAAIGEQKSLNLEQAKAQIFDIMKQTVKLNGYTQGQVDAINKVLDPVLQKINGQ